MVVCAQFAVEKNRRHAHSFMRAVYKKLATCFRRNKFQKKDNKKPVISQKLSHKQA